MKNLKKLMSALLALCLTAALICMPALAATDGDAPAAPKLEGTKTATPVTGEPGKYTVEVFVPGADPDNRHDEVILMVDGSYSGDKEWPAMKEAINTIGKAVLNGSGSTQLTLMAFGMGDNEVLVHVKDAADLATALGDLPGYLLRGVSSTNCEAGFTGVDEYIDDHDASLKDVIVIYITDGGINTDETPRLFYNWKDYAPKAQSVINYALNGVTVEAINGVTKESPEDFTNEVWKAVFAHSGMDITKEYPISEMERAFLQYDEDHGTNTSYSFLIAMKNSKYDSYPNVWSRTYDSVFDLAENAAVQDLYLVRYQNDDRATWMPEAAAVSEEDNIRYVKSDSISTLVDTLGELVPELSKTPFNDVVVTDYMSKWVNIDLDSLRIVDRNADTVIWNAKDGWKIDAAACPTAQEVPVTAELVDPADYEAGGDDVTGNANGDVYKLTWYVKDGALLRSDGYVLQYEVTVDTEEPGFRYDTDYPANGSTFADYKDESGQSVQAEIDVPDVLVSDPDPDPQPEPVYYHNITVNYFDKNTGATIAPQYATAFEEGTVYNVSAQNAIAIDGYTWDSTDRADLLTGTLTADVVINVFYVAGSTVIIPEELPPLDGGDLSGDTIIIEDEDIPLAEVPATGDPLTLMAAVSLISGAGVYFTRKREDEE